MTNHRTALLQAVKILKNAHISSAGDDAELLLCHILKCDKVALHRDNDKKLSRPAEKKLQRLINLRVAGHPVSQIIGYKYFYDLKFKVTTEVLTPRPESELLVTEAINFLKTLTSTKRLFAEIGVGSGCLSLSILKNTPKSQALAVDISGSALKTAKNNSKNLKLTKRIKFFKGDLLLPLTKKTFPLLIANLPYIPRSEKKHLPDLKFEPSSALYSGSDGLSAYRKLFLQLKKRQAIPRRLILEIGYNQGLAIKKIVNKKFPLAKIIIQKDLANFDRIAIIDLQN